MVWRRRTWALVPLVSCFGVGGCGGGDASSPDLFASSGGVDAGNGNGGSATGGSATGGSSGGWAGTGGSSTAGGSGGASTTGGTGPGGPMTGTGGSLVGGPDDHVCPPDRSVVSDLERDASFESDVWFPFDDGTSAQTLMVPESGGAEGTPSALHVSGAGFSDWGSGVGVSLQQENACFDMTGSTGVRFLVKGSGRFAVSVPIAAVLPPQCGGECWDDHTSPPVNAGNEWRQQTVRWSELRQAGWYDDVPFEPNQAVNIQFAVEPGQSYDLWLDEVELVYDDASGSGGAGGSGGSGGSSAGGAGASDSGGAGGSADGGMGGSGGSSSSGGTSSSGANAFTRHVTQATFNQFFPPSMRHPVYSYAGLSEAVESYPSFANSGDEQRDKRELAAFLANVAQETGRLEYAEEINKWDYCGNQAQYPCVGGQQYFGRGAMQISWNYNYGMASQDLGLGSQLLSNPGRVSSEPWLAWGSALWFWMTQVGAAWNTTGLTSHEAISAIGFGGTIQSINGALECAGARPDLVQLRVNYYQEICNLLGVAPGNNQYC